METRADYDTDNEELEALTKKRYFQRLRLYADAYRATRRFAKMAPGHITAAHIRRLSAELNEIREQLDAEALDTAPQV